MRERYDAFTEALLHETQALVVGGPADPDTVVGPLIDERNADRVRLWIDEAIAGGAKLLTGNERRGNVITPTLLTETDVSMRVECEEVFGPVATLASVDSLGEAIERTNASRFGLQAGIFTNDIRNIGQNTSSYVLACAKSFCSQATVIRIRYTSPISTSWTSSSGASSTSVSASHR